MSSYKWRLFERNCGRVRVAALMLCLFAGGFFSDLPAQTIWDGGGANNFWSTPANWNGDIAPPNPSGVALQFAGTVRPAPVVDAAWTAPGLQFNAGAGAFTLSGSQLTLGGSGIVNNSASVQTLSNALLLSANQTWSAVSGNLVVTGPVNLGSSALTDNTPTTRSLLLSGNVSGSGSLVKSGAGALTLNGTNTFSGGVTLNAGTLTAGTNSALGTGTLSLSGGTLNAPAVRNFTNAVILQASTALTGSGMAFSAPVSLNASTALTVSNNTGFNGGLTETGGSRAFTKGGAGLLLVNSSMGNSGNVTISGGSLALGPGVVLPSSNLRLNGGVLVTSGAFSRALGTGAGQVQFTASGGFAANGGPLVIDGFTGTPVWGTTASFLPGASTLTLGAPLFADTIIWTNDFSLGAGNRTITATSLFSMGVAQITGVISGAGGLTKNGGGRLDLVAANSFEGQFSVTDGTVGAFILANEGMPSSFGAGSGPNAPIRIGSGTTTATILYMGAGHSTDRALQLPGSTGGATLQVIGTGAAVFAGGVTATAAGAKILTLTGTSTAGDTLSGNVSDGSGTLAITKSGPGRWILSGTNTYSGPTAVTAGALEIRHGNALGTTAGNTTVSSGATLGLSGAISSPENISIAGGGAGGNGALRNLSGNNSLTGLTTLTGNATITSDSGALTLARPTGDALSGNFALTLGGAGNIIFQRRYNIGTAPLVKSGSGTVTLGPSATSAASGNISVTGGTFEVNGSVAAGGALVIASGARLAGSGSIARATTVGGFHSPGAVGATGQQSFSTGLNYESSSSLDWQLNANADTGPGANFDQALVTGGNLTIAPGAGISLVFNAPGSLVDWTNFFWNSDRQWLVVDHSGAGSSAGIFTLAGFSADSLGQPLAATRPYASFSVSLTGNDVYLNYVAIPEPATLGLLGGALVWLALLRRRRTG